VYLIGNAPLNRSPHQTPSVLSFFTKISCFPRIKNKKADH
jgi:hypothetical protein